MLSRCKTNTLSRRVMDVSHQRRIPNASSTSFRHYAPAGRSPKDELMPPSSSTQRSPLVRFLNPWIDMANATDDAILAFKVESVTRTFGVMAALMASLSAAALAVTPSSTNDEDYENDEALLANNIREVSSTEQPAQELTILEDILQHIVSSNDVAGTSLLVSWGVPPKKLSDIYSACSAASFCSSISAVGLASALNAWLGCTPPGGTKYFVRYHSLAICCIPALLAISTGLAGAALFIGLDRAKGTPISYID